MLGGPGTWTSLRLSEALGSAHPLMKNNNTIHDKREILKIKLSRGTFYCTQKREAKMEKEEGKSETKEGSDTMFDRRALRGTGLRNVFCSSPESCNKPLDHHRSLFHSFENQMGYDRWSRLGPQDTRAEVTKLKTEYCGHCQSLHVLQKTDIQNLLLLAVSQVAAVCPQIGLQSCLCGIIVLHLQPIQYSRLWNPHHSDHER